MSTAPSSPSEDKAVTYLEAIRQALREEMARDPSVFILGEDVGAYGGAFGVTKGLYEEFGARRVIDTPISESLIAGAAAGAALMGCRPVAEMQFADFISCAFDQVANQIGTMRYRHNGRVNVPLVIRCPSGGNIHGSMYHSQNPEGWFFHTPGLLIACPATPYDAKGLLKTAIRGNDPVLFFEYKFLYRRLKEVLPESDYTVPFGQAAVRRQGRDLSIVAYGSSVYYSLEAAQELARDGIEAEVVDLRTLRPLDKEAIFRTVSRTGRVLITHEDWKTGGVGAEIAAMLVEEQFDRLDAPVVRVCSCDTPVPFSPVLEAQHLPLPEKIVAAARRLVKA